MAVSYISQALLYLALLNSLALAAPGAGPNNCGCFSVSGPSQGTYNSYLFSDFRNIPNRNGQYNAEPRVLSEAQSQGQEAKQQGYLSSDAFTKHWGIQSWSSKKSSESPVRRQNTARNVYIQADYNPVERATTRLTLRATRLNNFAAVAEIDSVQNDIKYGSIRVRARVRGGAGAVAGIFTYADDNNESDFEILTKDPNNKIHCTNQPSVDSKGEVIPEAETVVNARGWSWSNWNTYRLDWTPRMSSWYINGVNVVNKSYSIPKKPSSLLLNMWSDSGVWSGVMPVRSNAYMDIGWIEMAFNSTSNPGSCSRVCNVNSERSLGSPQPAGRNWL